MDELIPRLNETNPTKIKRIEVEERRDDPGSNLKFNY